jgi:hypothetical protein
MTGRAHVHGVAWLGFLCACAACTKEGQHTCCVRGRRCMHLLASRLGGLSCSAAARTKEVQGVRGRCPVRGCVRCMNEEQSS